MAPFTGPVDREAIIARIKAYSLGDRPAQQRRQVERLVLGDDDPGDDGTDMVFDGAGGTILHFHGGGYAFGSPRTHARLGAQLRQLTGFRVMLPTYPLAPEYPWPGKASVSQG